jgi:hypothetical protein
MKPEKGAFVKAPFFLVDFSAPASTTMTPTDRRTAWQRLRFYPPADGAGCTGAVDRASDRIEETCQ